ncbi:hypothetical protein ACFCX4_09730 [Kitasatospora sp. NPDC056327]
MLTTASGVRHLTAGPTGADELRPVVTDGVDGTNSDPGDRAAPALSC